MTSREPSWNETLDRVINARLRSVHTSLPGTIRSYDADEQTAQVELAVQLEGPGGAYERCPPLADVPVLHPGAWTAGDRCLVVFAEEDPSKWWATGSVEAPAVQLRDAGVGPVGTERGPLLRADTGLLGEVETERATETKDGVVKGQTIVSGRCLMRADLVPGKSFHVSSETFTGNLVCRSTTHAGDSHSSDQWTVDWTGVPY